MASMLSVAIPALAGTASIGTAGLMDALNKADRSWALQNSGDPARLFDVRLVGLDLRPVTCLDGVSLHPSARVDDITFVDIALVPGLDDDLPASFEMNRAWAPLLAKWHSAGARIASSCTGAFLVAEAGLLDGRPATTHWLFADELARRYPRVQVATDRMIIDTGEIIRSGGATAFLNLVLYLVERFGGPERANLAAKVLLVDGHRPSQLPYIAFSPKRAHNDEIVHRVQQHIDLHMDEPLRVGQLAATFGISPRNLSRRFSTATGRGPHAYLQHMRIEHAKRLLETTAEPVERVRRLVGYHDSAAFRRAFKDSAGVAPSGYRTAYGPRQA